MSNKVRRTSVVAIFGVLSVGMSIVAFSQDEGRGGFEEEEINSAMSQYAALYLDNCAVCHGDELEGAAQGTPLVGELRHGAMQSDIERAIRDGFAQSGMPGWSATLSDGDIRNLALYVTETRADFQLHRLPLQRAARDSDRYDPQ